jgi:hypothetical protein
MRKRLILFLAAVLMSMPAFATYWVVMKDGTQYVAKDRPKIVNGKALITLQSGTMITVDPSAIDVAKSEQVTKLGGGNLIAVDTDHETGATAQQPSLGSAIKLKKLQPQGQQTDTAPVTPVPPANSLGNEVMDKFSLAYENVGIFEHKVTSPAAHTLHVELTADSEEKVFNAISATAFLMTRNAGVPGVQIDTVELFMKTTTGGSSGRFQMTRDDAAAIDGKQITREDYFVRKVIY